MQITFSNRATPGSLLADGAVKANIGRRLPLMYGDRQVASATITDARVIEGGSGVEFTLEVDDFEHSDEFWRSFHVEGITVGS